jgi:hypothetical protein
METSYSYHCYKSASSTSPRCKSANPGVTPVSPLVFLTVSASSLSFSKASATSTHASLSIRVSCKPRFPEPSDDSGPTPNVGGTNLLAEGAVIEEGEIRFRLIVARDFRRANWIDYLERSSRVNTERFKKTNDTNI